MAYQFSLHIEQTHFQRKNTGKILSGDSLILPRKVHV